MTNSFDRLSDPDQSETTGTNTAPATDDDTSLADAVREQTERAGEKVAEQPENQRPEQ